MQTLAFTLTETEWTEILNGNNSLFLQVVTSDKVRIHFNETVDPPALDVPTILVQSFPPRWDFEADNQTGQSHIWARADKGTAQIVVMRKA